MLFFFCFTEIERIGRSTPYYLYIAGREFGTFERERSYRRTGHSISVRDVIDGMDDLERMDRPYILGGPGRTVCPSVRYRRTINSLGGWKVRDYTFGE